MAEKNITLQVGSDEIDFKVTTDDFNRYTNGIAMDNKITPAKNFLRRSLVDKAQKELLDNLCDRGLTMNMVAELVQEFQGEITIEVKK